MSIFRERIEVVRDVIAKRTLELYAGHKVGGIPDNPEVISQFPAHLQSSVFKLSKDLIDSIHEEGIVAYTS